MSDTNLPNPIPAVGSHPTSTIHDRLRGLGYWFDAIRDTRWPAHLKPTPNKDAP